MEKIELINEKFLEKIFYTNLKKGKLPDFLLYCGENGAKNWINLIEAKNFSYINQLKNLLQDNIKDLIKLMSDKINIVSIGVGTGDKELIILKELVKKSSPKYYPIDINTIFVDLALKKVNKLSIEKKGFVGFIEDLTIMKNYWEKPIMLCMLGNTFCNYEPDFILKTINENIEENDLFLFDCNIIPDNVKYETLKDEFSFSYQSKENIKFNIQPLINYGIPKENIEFKIELLPKESFNGILFKTHKSLIFTKKSKISIGSNSIIFNLGDTINMGFTYKFNVNQIKSFLKNNGFLIIKRFTDNTNVLLLTRKSGGDKDT